MLLAVLFLHSCLSFAQSLLPEDGSAHVSKWYYNPRRLDVVDKDAFFQTLQTLGVKPIEVTDVGSFVQDSLFFNTKGQRLKWAVLSEVAITQSGPWTNSVWDSEHDGLINLTGPVPHAPDIQLKWFMAEGGATISGHDKQGRPYILTTMNAYNVIANQIKHTYIKTHNLWPTQKEAYEQGIKEIGEIQKLALSRAPNPERSEVLAYLSQDLNIPIENIHFVDSYQFLHIDVVMLPLPGKKILIHSVEKAQALIESLELPTDTKATLRGSVDENKKALDKISSDLVEMGFEVIPVAGIWTLPGNRYINFFNGFQGISEADKNFLITNTSHGYAKAEKYFTEAIIKAGFKGDVFYLGKFHPFAGIDCMGAIAP